MDELHDAIQDAQYIGAVTNAHRGPSAAFYNPSQSELSQFVEKQERTFGSDWLSLENILDQPLGFYFMRRFCDTEQHGVRKLDFLTEVTKYRSLVSTDQRFARAREIWDQFCVVPPQFGSSLAGPTGPTDSSSASPVSTVTSSPAPTLSSRSLTSPSDNECGETGRSRSSRFTLGSLKDLNVASITTNGIIFWRKGESTVLASDVASLCRECASEMSPIGVGGEVTQRVGHVIKRKSPPSKSAPGSSSPRSGVLESNLGGRSSASPTVSQSTNGRSNDKGSLVSDELKSCPPSLFDELEACRLGANGAAEVKRMKFFDPVDWVKMENMAVNPPFVPDNEINAASQADIGSFDIAIVKGVKISDQDQAAYSNWDFVCPETFQREAIEYLEWEVKHGPCTVTPNSNSCCTIL
uniref:RGS domain-containing protein n=1 Tax=Globisporangium ultimum (strain ATCC 200006 / CBS 805.95 / DAOM BR144) TaxID=431595 RepID=K3WCY7_GLOUD